MFRVTLLGEFVCEYTGEYISEEEGNNRDEDSYFFDVVCVSFCLYRRLRISNSKIESFLNFFYRLDDC